jgi:3-deoxy-D-manno-octulosonic-acid transferase
LILGASTHAPEESVLLEALELVRSRITEKPRLMLAPRHPERFAEVAALIQKSGFTWTSRTAPAHSLDQNCDVILVDTIGELAALYSLASVVFVGGSIIKKGGHNIVEPAAAGAAIVTGAHTHNFDAIVSEFVKEQALIQLPPLPPQNAAVHLADIFAELLHHGWQRNELGQQAKELVERNLGAVTRTLNLLEPFLSRR